MRGKKQHKRREDILNVIPIFLAKTYRIIDNPDYREIIGWTDDEESFAVRNLSRLTNEIFPKHFKHCNFASFVRQLNMYGFHKIRSEDGQSNVQVYKHPYFKKNSMYGILRCRELLTEIKRRCTAIEPIQPMPTSEGTVAVSSREEQLKREVDQLRVQQQEMQQFVKILVEQNNSIAMQNRNYISIIEEMKLSYRKKIETLFFLLYFRKGTATQDKNDFTYSPHFENMLEAFDSHTNDKGLLALEPPNMLRRKSSGLSESLKMITARPASNPRLSPISHFQQDSHNEGHGGLSELYLDKDEKEDMYKIINQMESFPRKKVKFLDSDNSDCEKDDLKNSEKKGQKQSQNQQRHKDDDQYAVPASPASSVKSYLRLNEGNKNSLEWDDIMDKFNRSDYSDLDTDKKEEC